jgi:hypothetical protein
MGMGDLMRVQEKDCQTQAKRGEKAVRSQLESHEFRGILLSFILQIFQIGDVTTRDLNLPTVIGLPLTGPGLIAPDQVSYSIPE